jgi:hypothetical protein
MNKIELFADLRDTLVISKEDYLTLRAELKPALDGVALDDGYMANERLGNREQCKDFLLPPLNNIRVGLNRNYLSQQRLIGSNSSSMENIPRMKSSPVQLEALSRPLLMRVFLKSGFS